MTFSVLRTPLFLLSTLYFVLCTQIFAECNPSAKTAGFDQYSDGQYSYECNVKNICLGQKFGGSGWDFNTSKQLIKTHDKTKYPNLGQESKSFDEVRTIYQKTQDNIFECALLKSKYAAHTQIVKDYNPTEKSQEYLKKLNEDIKSQLRERDCLSPDDSDKVYNYKDLLDSLSYEECVYNMYLYYYEEKSWNSIWMVVWSDITGYKKAIDISREVNQTKVDLKNEYELSHKSLSNALKGYENFHKTYVPHIMLQMKNIELTENKTFIAKIMHGIKQLVSLFTGAQKQSN